MKNAELIDYCNLFRIKIRLCITLLLLSGLLKYVFAGEKVILRQNTQYPAKKWANTSLHPPERISAREP